VTLYYASVNKLARKLPSYVAELSSFSVQIHLLEGQEIGLLRCEKI
jgi:hypothetical protein